MKVFAQNMLSCLFRKTISYSLKVAPEEAVFVSWKILRFKNQEKEPATSIKDKVKNS